MVAGSQGNAGAAVERNPTTVPSLCTEGNCLSGWWWVLAGPPDLLGVAYPISTCDSQRVPCSMYFYSHSHTLHIHTHTHTLTINIYENGEAFTETQITRVYIEGHRRLQSVRSDIEKCESIFGKSSRRQEGKDMPLLKHRVMHRRARLLCTSTQHLFTHARLRFIILTHVIQLRKSNPKCKIEQILKEDDSPPTVEMEYGT